MTLVGVVLLLAGGGATWRLARRGGPYRAGPWPGLTPRGAGLLLSCALLLAGGQLILGTPQRALPDLLLLAALAFAPLTLATRLTRLPGAAAAVCGAYLLPRTLISLVHPALEPPPLLLVPALVFDVAQWLRASDLANLANAWPGRRNPWRTRKRPVRDSRAVQVSGRTSRAGAVRAAVVVRAASAGALFGLTLAAIEPSYAVLLGAEPATWSGPNVGLAAVLGAATCALLSLAAVLRKSS